MHGGSFINVPSLEVLCIVQVVRIWLISAWAQSRDITAMSSLLGFEGIMLASKTVRLPRSKVYGIGLATVMELDGADC